MNALKQQSLTIAGRVLANVNRSSPGKGRALVLNAALDQLSPGLSKEVARRVVVGGGSQRALRNAISESLLDLTWRRVDPSLNDLFDDIIGTQNETAAGSGSSSRSSTQRASDIMGVVGRALDAGVSTFTRIFDTVTDARDARTAAAHEQRMAELAAETEAATAAASATLASLTPPAATTTGDTSTGLSPALLLAGVAVVGLLGAGAYYLFK